MGFKPRNSMMQHNVAKGKKSEEKFKNIMENIGIRCVKTGTQYDKYYNVDFFVGNKTPVDLKGSKKTDSIWLEKRNIYGGKGSLYGFAKYMVMDLVDINTFIFYNRLDLVQYISRFKDVCTDRGQYYCIYTRPGNKEQIIKVREHDLRPYEKIRIQY